MSPDTPEQQFTNPTKIGDGPADQVRGWWPDLDRRPRGSLERNVSELRGGWEVMACYGRWLLNRRICTRRPVQEKMTEFWEAMPQVPVSVLSEVVTRRFGVSTASVFLGFSPSSVGVML